MTHCELILATTSSWSKSAKISSMKKTMISIPLMMSQVAEKLVIDQPNQEKILNGRQPLWLAWTLVSFIFWLLLILLTTFDHFGYGWLISTTFWSRFQTSLADRPEFWSTDWTRLWSSGSITSCPPSAASSPVSTSEWRDSRRKLQSWCQNISGNLKHKLWKFCWPRSISYSWTNSVNILSIKNDCCVSNMWLLCVVALKSRGRSVITGVVRLLVNFIYETCSNKISNGITDELYCSKSLTKKGL